MKNGSITSYENLGKIGGVNGTISNKIHPYKMSQDKYLGYLKKYIGKKIDILLTHDTPKFENFVGREEIYNMVLKIKPLIYIYGHCHHKKMHSIHKNIHFLNVDGRVLVIN